MSHFTVIVIGDEIDEQMAPYAEQNAEQQYLVFEDNEDQSFEEYKNEEVEIVVLADGSLYSKNESQFSDYNKDTMLHEYKFPEGSIIRKGHYTEIYNTFEEYMNDYGGSSERDIDKGRYGYWTNPNAKWDWYS